MAAALKVEIGFEGGQVLPARLSEATLKELRLALDAGSGWLDLECDDDGTIAVDLARVAFLRIASSDQHIGF